MYEDVEGVKKMLLEQNSRKRTAGLKSKNVHAVLTPGFRRLLLTFFYSLFSQIRTLTATSR